MDPSHNGTNAPRTAHTGQQGPWLTTSMVVDMGAPSEEWRALWAWLLSPPNREQEPRDEPPPPNPDEGSAA